jgi:hypothetical protein
MWLLGHVAWIEAKRNSYRLLVGQQEGKRELENPRCSWVDSITMDLRQIGWDGVDRVGLSRDRNRWGALANAVINFGFHKMLGNCHVAPQLVTSQVVLNSVVNYLVSPIQKYTMAQQLNGRSPLCTSRGVFRSLCWLNDLLHTLQPNGRSPRGMRWCLFSFLCSENFLLHTWQEYWHSFWWSVWVPYKITGKNMRIPARRYLSLKPQSSENLVGVGRGVKGDRERIEGSG